MQDVDYGQIPGTDGLTLYDPGAQKMALLAGVGVRVQFIGRDDQGVTYHCTVTRPGSDVVMAECDGYAGYDEDRYYKPVEVVRAKAERDERRWAAQDKRPVKPEKWANVAEYRAPWNTLLKMAQKRARVGAISAALALGGLFNVEADDAGADQETGEIPGPPANAARDAGAPAPGSRRPVERGRRPEAVPVEVYDNLPEAGGPGDAGRPFS